MKIRKLNARGFAHDVLMVAVVAVFSIGGVAYLVASHAAPNPNNWALVGSASLPQQNQTVTAYACKTVVSSSVWQVKGLFTLSSSYKGAAWKGSITDTGNNLLKGSPSSVSGTIPSTVSPSVILRLDVVNAVARSPLTFGYSAGTSISGSIAQNYYPDKLPTCNQ